MSVQSKIAAPSLETVREFLISGLIDAHAMESQAISLTTTQADRLKHYPELEVRIREHVRETEGQRDRLVQCLDKFDASPSTLKDAALKLGANLASLTHSMADDEVVKNSFASFAFENFEIAAYRGLIETAHLLREPDVEEVCRQNLAEEERMAKWIHDHLPGLIHQYLGRKSADVEAKR